MAGWREVHSYPRYYLQTGLCGVSVPRQAGANVKSARGEPIDDYFAKEIKLRRVVDPVE